MHLRHRQLAQPVNKRSLKINSSFVAWVKQRRTVELHPLPAKSSRQPQPASFNGQALNARYAL
jgi:hypothetical protein